MIGENGAHSWSTANGNAVRTVKVRQPSEAEPYSLEDFTTVPKIDAHVHVNVPDRALLEQARADGFQLMLVTVDSPDFPGFREQRDIAIAFARESPEEVQWVTTFSMRGFGEPGWEQQTDADLTAAKAAGTRGVKIWKNVGMTEKDAQGKLIMLDHPGLSAVARRIRSLGLVLLGHQAEPRNCWRPFEEMTTENDRRYFRRRPHYHLHAKTAFPSHAELVSARDRFLTSHPGLQYVGAHMGSLEHDVGELSDFLERFPGAAVDLAARMSEVQHQSVHDLERVRAFFIRHQDRILYGTDLTLGVDTDPSKFRRAAHAIWTSDWRYLATSERQHINALGTDVPGLALPRSVIDKLYYGNAARVFGCARPSLEPPRQRPQD